MINSYLRRLPREALLRVRGQLHNGTLAPYAYVSGDNRCLVGSAADAVEVLYADMPDTVTDFRDIQSYAAASTMPNTRLGSVESHYDQLCTRFGELRVHQLLLGAITRLLTPR